MWEVKVMKATVSEQVQLRELENAGSWCKGGDWELGTRTTELIRMAVPLALVRYPVRLLMTICEDVWEGRPVLVKALFARSVRPEMRVTGVG